MRMMGGGPGPWWPLLVVMVAVMVAAGVAIIAVATHGRRGSSPLPGPGGHRSRRDRDRQRAGEDPLAVLRERYARGEIDHDEFERYLDRLLRTEPPLPPGRGGERD